MLRKFFYLDFFPLDPDPYNHSHGSASQHDTTVFNFLSFKNVKNSPKESVDAYKSKPLTNVFKSVYRPAGHPINLNTGYPAFRFAGYPNYSNSRIRPVVFITGCHHKVQVSLKRWVMDTCFLLVVI